ncbi:MAG: galactokinase, partial [Rhodospirillales bacterium]|nr:galactokinase [Rhodospirillales bacterium]
VDPAEVAVLVINSNVKHELVGGEYAERRAQCEAAAKTMNVSKLRDADLRMLDAHREQMDELSYRRAHHVITENQRTLDAAEALTHGDYVKTGELMNESHAAMRDDFEITVPQIDKLVEIVQNRIGADSVYGSRMTGGGFGGCTVTLVKPDAVDAVSEGIAAEYEQATGIKPTWFATTPGDGAMQVTL